VHDFEPGIADSGLFWTIAIPKPALDVDPKEGKARFRMDDLRVPDYGNFLNAVSSVPPGPDPASTPSRVSFDVKWDGKGDTVPVRDDTFGFSGEFVTGGATIMFRARNEHSEVEFRADKDGQATVGFGPAGVGSEVNGVFFS
jgi:hypothetical protein